MIHVNFNEMNESLKTFILSVSLGSEAVIDSLLKTADSHLNVLERINEKTPNAKLHFDCSVRIITQAFTSLVYINHHSADLFSDESIHPLANELSSVDERFNSVLDRIRKEFPNGFEEVQ